MKGTRWFLWGIANISLVTNYTPIYIVHSQAARRGIANVNSAYDGGRGYALCTKLAQNKLALGYKVCVNLCIVTVCVYTFSMPILLYSVQWCRACMVYVSGVVG